MAAKSSRSASPHRQASERQHTKLRVTTDIVLQRVLPMADALALEFLVAAGIMIALLVGKSWWIGGVAGLLLSLLLVVRIRGTSVPRALAARLDFFFGRQSKTRKTPPAEPFDTPLDGGAQIGFRWDGRTLLTLLKIEEKPQALTVMEPGMTVSGETVSVELLVECMRQFDIRIDSIDVISQGARSFGHTRIASVYDAVLGPLPAIAQRSVWIAIRFDPAQCAEAVTRRGGGRNGILRAAITATRRVANQLTEAGLHTRILTAAEIAQATNQLADGVNLANLEENWTCCSEGNFRLYSYSLKGNALSTAGLGMVWTVPSYSTTVCVSLQNSVKSDYTRIRGLVRFDSHGYGGDINLPGLVPLRGQQFNALVSSLPLPPPRRPLGSWVYGRGTEDFRDLALPASGCGQVIGADEYGRAVALPMFGQQIERVEISGTLHLAQQVVLRALALGARVLVHTRRPALWRGMVGEVGDNSLLWVTEFNRGSIQAGSDRNYSVAVFDGVVEQVVRIGVTAMIVAAPGTVPSPDADVSLEQLDEHSDTVKVSTSAGSAVVSMVATDEEMRYLKESLNVQYA
ncbi:type VII secretion protein EccE [Mycobacteroides abscessus]|uniref:type VII secretion protein EccE n=1 Tax=Mycobacteroides abscessus TaxID=36809 RepID=UPI0002586122|nr:type VII secretion protein EccE [Mycobacteroides abscessus]EIC62635.1 ESX-2 secretion system protein EccE2 [Mycobacteroides abscessus M93]MDM2349357.1 type VII secretion protein EccE [Mycobacteroides abscessus]MDM2360239.1 type VII secretion protein EccE [Mycobacteroides abscessus]SHQ95074.1 type VII secretion protein EccE [Mycobacteroides abscessus subsp. abscessus]SHS89920.1 type VII secretion protein EccE [Mycobacteroides abscessus subsp. abscessus]